MIGNVILWEDYCLGRLIHCYSCPWSRLLKKRKKNWRADLSLSYGSSRSSFSFFSLSWWTGSGSVSISVSSFLFFNRLSSFIQWAQSARSSIAIGKKSQPEKRSIDAHANTRFLIFSFISFHMKREGKKACVRFLHRRSIVSHWAEAQEGSDS